MSLENFQTNPTLEEEMPPEVKIPQDHPEAIADLRTNLRGLENSPWYIPIEAIKQECGEDPVLLKLLETVREQSFYYTETLCRWHELSLKAGEMTTEDYQAAKQEIDQARHRSHEAMIDDMRILARTMNKAGKDGAWINRLHTRHEFANAALSIAFQEMIRVNQSETSN